ncbi:GroES-like protein [Rhizodiscina lignyota]|uniref:GroES-like protein n=1 Tax=Rhizodiscina lignyota TaxID=1504668 RepID=A0A9P4I2C5_9PEZI|nr:GroES-like protein [Rhizodiscina lignyota]
MKAARWYGRKDIRIEDVPEPVPGENEVLVEVEWCGICGSDLHEYLTGPIAIPRADAPHPLTKSTPPVTMGHEFCGTVLKVPSGSKLQPGQPVVADPRLYCRSCHVCTTTRDTNGCARYGFLGLSGGGGGGLSSLVAVDERMLYTLPNDSLLETAAVVEPLAVAWHGMRGAEMTNIPDKSILILGGGPIGIAMIHVLRANGAKKIYVSEPTVQRRAQTEKIADVVIDPKTQKVVEKCMELTEGKGIDVVFDCAGVTPAMMDGMMSLRMKGTYMNVAGWETPFTPHFGLFMIKELTIRASLAYNDDDFRETVAAFCEGKFKGVENMITSRIPLQDVVGRGIEELINNKEGQVKILVSPRK